MTGHQARVLRVPCALRSDRPKHPPKPHLGSRIGQSSRRDNSGPAGSHLKVSGTPVRSAKVLRGHTPMRAPRFRLRTLMLAVAILAVLLGRWANFRYQALL